MDLFHRILKARGITSDTKAVFLSPNYNAKHDPFLLPDMQAAVDRLVEAQQSQERITIYGDYDIDGLTATTVLLDALASFGFENVKAFIPNRFTEGYGLTVDAIERIAKDGAQLIITVDCGSLSHKEITRARELGVDVIVTDHHNVAPEQPPAVAVINPKRLLADYPDEYDHYVLKEDSKMVGKLYPFLDLPGVGVAFKLVQALQTKLGGLEVGQEKWLLDLVALGTVCDVVTLVDENRTHVFWGLKVLAKTRRIGLKALMAVAGVRAETVNARSLGFSLGPRMNAAGRLETAQYALDMLTATNPMEALKFARKLDDMNQARRREQDEILKEAIQQAELFLNDAVLVVAAEGWNHGIVGIVAAKLLEKFQKPAFVLAIDGEDAKGSARSYGEFSAADAIRSADDIITKGGGHKLAAGVTLPAANVEAFRKRVNDFYKAQKLTNQAALLLPIADADARLEELTEKLITDITTLEPFGNGNPQPILRTENVTVMNVRRMGDSGQHVKLTVKNETSQSIDLLAFSAPGYFFVEIGVVIRVWYAPEFNEWQGRKTIEGKLLHIEPI
ncbi:MAG TPA: DHHA1 domain-containing protein [Dongiaceae bacterium]|nr:DHHA1 domain-containing protein [Dongiaceae bacterium]